jgi:hypothetical protein
VSQCWRAEFANDNSPRLLTRADALGVRTKLLVSTEPGEAGVLLVTPLVPSRAVPLVPWQVPWLVPCKVFRWGGIDRCAGIEGLVSPVVDVQKESLLIGLVGCPLTKALLPATATMKALLLVAAAGDGAEEEPALDLKDLEPGVKEPDVKEPDVKEPDVKEPDVKEPGVKEPGVKVPQRCLADGKGPLGIASEDCLKVLDGADVVDGAADVVRAADVVDGAADVVRAADVVDGAEVWALSSHVCCAADAALGRRRGSMVSSCCTWSMKPSRSSPKRAGMAASVSSRGSCLCGSGCSQ